MANIFEYLRRHLAITFSVSAVLMLLSGAVVFAYVSLNSPTINPTAAQNMTNSSSASQDSDMSVNPAKKTDSPTKPNDTKKPQSTSTPTVNTPTTGTASAGSGSGDTGVSPIVTNPVNPPVYTGPTVKRFWNNSDWQTTFNFVSDSPKADAFIAHTYDEWTWADQYHASNPGGKAYFYADFGVAGDIGTVATVLDTTVMDANNWWARYNGAKIPNPWGGSSWVVDLGKPGVAQAYINSLNAKWGSRGWQGIFADDVNAWRNLGYNIDGYSSAADWINRAVKPLMQTVTTSIETNKQGVVIPNIGNWPQEPDMDGVSALTSGALNEFYLLWPGGGGQDVGDIENEYNSMRGVISRGDSYYGIVHSNELHSYAFCAAAIMGEAGKVYVATQNQYGSEAPLWDAVFDTNLGAPLQSTQHTTGSTAWSRQFVNKKLTINTSAQTCTMQ